MGIIEAVQALLAEEDGQTTREIVRQLRDRGIFSKSQNLTATVYATLHNASPEGDTANPKFERREKKWFLAKGPKGKKGK